MKTRGLSAAVLILALAAAHEVAQAADTAWFSGIRVAPWMSHNDALMNLDRGDATNPPPRKSRLNGSQAAAVPSRRVDVEVAYLDANPADGTVNPARLAQPGRDFRVAGVGTWALDDKFGVLGRVGAYHGDVDGSALYRLTPDSSSLRPTFGMGLRYDLSSNLRLQGGWDRYHLGQSLRPGDDGVDLLSIGLKYRF